MTIVRVVGIRSSDTPSTHSNEPFWCFALTGWATIHIQFNLSWRPRTQHCLWVVPPKLSCGWVSHWRISGMHWWQGGGRGGCEKWNGHQRCFAAWLHPGFLLEASWSWRGANNCANHEGSNQHWNELVGLMWLRWRRSLQRMLCECGQQTQAQIPFASHGMQTIQLIVGKRLDRRSQITAAQHMSRSAWKFIKTVIAGPCKIWGLRRASPVTRATLL